MALKLPGPLVTTEWLADNLMDEDIRIIDCSYFLEKSKNGLILRNERAEWEKGHIPNSIYIDLSDELSDKSSKLPFMMPPEAQFERIMSEKGIGNNHTVITYDRGKMTWASRVRIMFLSLGFKNVAVLDGGWNKWTKEDKLVSSNNKPYDRTDFNASKTVSRIFTDKNDILKTIEDGSAVIINALDKVDYMEGHIPGSINIPFAALIDEETNCFLPADSLKEIYEKAGIKKEDRIITYCGGGIAASSGATALMLAGFDNVSVYDGSMSEWISDPDLPIEKGEG
jgi:thiosulfate/3-mercaptopyruvate sulfurtransferase